jgi:hypothetical protein
MAFTESRGVSGLRSVPLLLVNVVESLGLILPLAALGAACTAQRRTGGSLPAIRTMVTSGLAVAGLTILMVGIGAPALRRSVLASVYEAEGAPAFDPRGLSVPQLLRDYSQSASAVASSGERVTTEKLGFEVYRRVNAGMLGFVLPVIGWLAGWWISMTSKVRVDRPLELGAVLFFIVSAFVSEYVARGLSPTWANLVGLMIPGTALGVLALSTWAATIWRRDALTT